MSNICTSIEESKKLLELGVNHDTADMYYEKRADGYFLSVGETTFQSEALIPAWSLNALLELLPYYELISHSDGQHEISIGRLIAFLGDDGDTVLDVVFDGVCWMIENGYIKTEKP